MSSRASWRFKDSRSRALCVREDLSFPEVDGETRASHCARRSCGRDDDFGEASGGIVAGTSASEDGGTAVGDEGRR
jgi:hypothetical protein